MFEEGIVIRQDAAELAPERSDPERIVAVDRVRDAEKPIEVGAVAGERFDGHSVDRLAKRRRRHYPFFPAHREFSPGRSDRRTEATMSEEAVGRRRLFGWAAITSLAGLVWSRTAWADSKGSDNGNAFGEKVAGTYFLNVQHEGFPLALALVTLTRDGGFISNDTSDQGAGGLVTKDGPVQGTWKKSGPRRIKARTLYFAFDPSGIPIWIARTTGEFEFDKHFNGGTGKLTVHRFTLDQDPLNPNTLPADELEADFTARRLTAD
jgi:hypothetical protein